MRFTLSFFKFFMCWWGSLFVSKSIVELTVDWRYHFYVPVFPKDHVLWALLTLALLNLGTIIWAKMDQFFRQENVARLARTKFNPYFLASFNLCILLSVVVSSGCMVRYLGRTLAYGADTVGAIELGERIYSVMVATDDSSLITVSARGYRDKGDRHQEDAKLNDIVGRVYGLESPQMAHRYVLLGVNTESNINNHALAEVYFEKALSIYRKENSLCECITVLSLLANAQYCKHDTAGLKNTLSEAVRSLQKCKERKLLRPMTLLWLTAKLSGNNVQAEIFNKNGRTISTLADKDS
jgi:hypothetical protein